MLEGLHDLYSIIALRVAANLSESGTSFLPSVKKIRPQLRDRSNQAVADAIKFVHSAIAQCAS